MPSTQASLLARLRQGADAGTWRLFVELYTPLIFRYCRRRDLQDADAEEVTQAVMARVFKAIGTFAYDPERGRFRSWLGVIVTREIARYQRKVARPGQGSGAGGGDAVVEHVAGAEEGEWLEEFNAHVLTTALDRIRTEFDEPTWQAFDWTWIGEVEPQIAAERLGKTAGWVYKARFRVLRRLRAEVEYLAEDAASVHRPQ